MRFGPVSRLPSAANCQTHNRSVWVLRNGAPAEVKIEIGSSDGTRTEVDIIVCATGFHANRFLFPMRITGRDGRVLSDFELTPSLAAPLWLRDYLYAGSERVATRRNSQVTAPAMVLAAACGGGGVTNPPLA